MIDLSFSINRNGALISTTVTKSSGLLALDQTAIMIIRNSQPFPPPPIGLEGDKFDFRLPLKFGAPPPPGYPARLDKSDRPILHPGLRR